MKLFLDRYEVLAQFTPHDWQDRVFCQWITRVINDRPAYPCPFAVSGVSSNQVRYLFLDHEDDVATLAGQLGLYLKEARSIGRTTALVVFYRPRALSILPLETYRCALSGLLRSLRLVDKAPWPASVPEDEAHPDWQFCFAGEPVFVMASTPAHVARRSRQAPTFTLTFQPGWAFDDMGEDGYARSLSEVKHRLALFDAIEPSPAFASTACPAREKFFLCDDNGEAAERGI